MILDTFLNTIGAIVQGVFDIVFFVLTLPFSLFNLVF